MFDIIAYAVCFVALAVASYTDIKTREVPDWLSYSLIAVGLGIRAIASLVYLSPSYIIDGAVGFAIFLALAMLLFYTGLWGGGDSKILMGIGALLGIKFEFLPFVVVLFIVLLLVGAVYGFIYSMAPAIKNKKVFLERFRQIVNNKNVMLVRKILIGFFIAFLVFYFFESKNLSPSVNLVYVFSVFIIFLVFFLWIFAKAVEESCMHKLVPPEKLTEGDWIVKDVVVDGKRICGPKDLGIEKKQIAELIRLKKKNKVKKILIKEGIPFIPVFLIGFVITLAFKEQIVRLFFALM